MKHLTNYSGQKLDGNHSAKYFDDKLIYSKNYNFIKANIHFGAP